VGGAEVGVVVGDPDRQASGVAAGDGADPGHDDLDLIHAEFSGHRVAFGDHISGRLPPTPGQIEGDGPSVAVSQGWGD
jgi:hypothetical protein